MLSSGMITPLFFIFPGNFTHSLDTAVSGTTYYCTVHESSVLAAYRVRSYKQFLRLRRRLAGAQQLLIQLAVFRISLLSTNIWRRGHINGVNCANLCNEYSTGNDVSVSLFHIFNIKINTRRILLPVVNVSTKFRSSSI
jgi:hypothetical protein